MFYKLLQVAGRDRGVLATARVRAHRSTAAADRGAGARAADRVTRPRPREIPRHTLSRPRHELPDRARGRAKAQGNLVYPRRGLCGRRAQARPDRAHRRDVPVIVIAPYDRIFDKTVSAEGDHAGHCVAPLVYAVPVQLIAYHTAVIMGTGVDQPRNLAKSVTVE
jgi:hypothetical protein